MRHLLNENAIAALWIVFVLYWVVAAVRQKVAKRNESLWVRTLYTMVAVICFVFLLSNKDNIAVLWVLLGVYFAFAVLRIRDTKQRQSLFSRLPHIAAMMSRQKRQL